MIVLFLIAILTKLPITGNTLTTDGEFVYLIQDRSIYYTQSDSINFVRLNINFPMGFRVNYLDGDQFFIYLANQEKILQVRRSDLDLRVVKLAQGIIDIASDDEGRLLTIEDWGHKVLLKEDILLPGIDLIKQAGFSNGRFYLVGRDRIIFLNDLMVPDSMVELPKENIKAVIYGKKIYAYHGNMLYRYKQNWHMERMPISIKDLVVLNDWVFILDVNSTLYFISD